MFKCGQNVSGVIFFAFEIRAFGSKVCPRHRAAKNVTWYCCDVVLCTQPAYKYGGEEGNNSVTTSSSSSEASLSSWQLCDESDIEESLTSVDILMQQSNETAAKVHSITSHDVTIKLN